MTSQLILEPGRVAKIYVGDANDGAFVQKAFERYNIWSKKVFGGFVTDFKLVGIQVSDGISVSIGDKTVNLWMQFLQAVRFESTFNGADEITEINLPDDDFLIDVDESRVL